jgi:hypothetical protein
MGITGDARSALLSRMSFAAYSYLFGDSTSKMIDNLYDGLKLFGVSNQRIVWAATTTEDVCLSVNKALVYVTQNTSQTNEYSVIVRGTNPFSFVESWCKQDFDVGYTVPWTSVSPASPAKDALISRATATSIQIHLGLSYGGQDLFTFLCGLLAAGNTINFAGHSLGGLMAPVLALLFYENNQEQLPANLGFTVCSLAGPSAGNAAFAKRLEAVFNAPPFIAKNFIRFDLDIAPRVWVKKDMDLAFGFYDFFLFKVPMTSITRYLLGGFMGLVHDIDYQQPYPGSRMLNLDDRYAPLAQACREAFRASPAFARMDATLRQTAGGASSELQLILETLEWLLVAGCMHVFPYWVEFLADEAIPELAKEFATWLI